VLGLYPPRPSSCGQLCHFPHGLYACEPFEVKGSVFHYNVPGITFSNRDVYWLCFKNPCEDPWVLEGPTLLHANPIPYTPDAHPWPFVLVTPEGARERIPNPPGPPPDRPADDELCFSIPWRTAMRHKTATLEKITLRGWCMKCSECDGDGSCE
jgi:hypothetical protein